MYNKPLKQQTTFDVSLPNHNNETLQKDQKEQDKSQFMVVKFQNVVIRSIGTIQG